VLDDDISSRTNTSPFDLFQKLINSISLQNVSFEPPYSVYDNKKKLINSDSLTNDIFSDIHPNVSASKNNPFLLFFNKYHISLTEILLVLCDVWRDMELRTQNSKGKQFHSAKDGEITNVTSNSNEKSVALPFPLDITPQQLLRRTLAFLHTLFYTFTSFLSKKYPIFVIPPKELNRLNIEKENAKIGEKSMNFPSEKQDSDVDIEDDGIKINLDKENMTSTEASEIFGDSQKIVTNSEKKKDAHSLSVPLLPMPFVMFYLFYIGILAHFNRYGELIFALRNNIIPPHPEILHQLLVLSTRRLRPQNNNSNTIFVLPPYCYLLLPYVHRMSFILSYYYPEGWNMDKCQPFLGSATVGLPIIASLLAGIYLFLYFRKLSIFIG
jgi:hypothetical protein